MQVPIRKAGKYSNKQADYNITQAKFDELKKELNKLKDIHPQAAVELRRLAEMGDLSENAAYTIAKGKLRRINGRILEIENILKNAVIIVPTKNNSVQLGSVVTLEFNNKQVTYTILGSSETNPSLGIISNQSPIGQALMGHKVGDVVKAPINQKDIEYKIINLT